MHGLFFFLLMPCVQAQPDTWIKAYTGNRFDFGKAVTAVYDGGFAIAGATSSAGSGATDVYLIRTDRDGNKLWSKTYGGHNIDWACDIVQLPDSSLMMSGYTNSKGNGGYDLYVIRVDAAGTLLWDSTYGGSDWDFGYASHLSSDGGLWVAGETYSKGNGNSDGWLAHIASDGTLVWDSTYGGPQKDAFRDIDTLMGGGFAVIGETESFGNGMRDLYLMRLADNGTVVWDTALGGPNDEFGRGVIQGNDSMLYAIGGSVPESDSAQIWALSYHSNGSAVRWQKFLGGMENDQGVSLIQNNWNDGIYYVGNYASSGSGPPGDVAKFIFNPAGVFIASHTEGEAPLDEASMVILTPDSGVLVVGTTRSYGVPYSAVYALKFDGFCETAPDVEVVTDVNAIARPPAPHKGGLSPNPVSRSGVVHLESAFAGPGGYTIHWYDVSGRSWGVWPVQETSFPLYARLPAGVLLYRICKNKVFCASGRLVITP